MFKNMNFYFNPGRFSKSRLKVFITQVNTHGGNVMHSYDSATHIICEESCDQTALPTSFWENGNIVVGSLWLSNCLKKNTIVDIQSYIINKPASKCKSCSLEPERTKEKKSLKSDDPKGFACSQASLPSTQESLNSSVLNQLNKLAETYRARGDQWRAHGYEKAISAIRRYGKEITCYEEVVALEGVGPKMASKVMEVIETGKLRKVEELCDTEESQVVNIFANVWGAGPSTANAWYTKGHRTLDNLIEKETLTKQQQIGIKYYEEFLQKMPRSEVEEIGQEVDAVAKGVNPTLTTMLCGSYRRGKQSCGDVDVVVIRGDQFKSKDVLTSILNKLKESGFVTDDLVSLEKSGNQRKYLGVCRLPGEGRLHRRLDIFVVPKSESACAIMHYTGSALFNRSIRMLAAKKDMHLSEHSLTAGVVRKGSEILTNGHQLPTPTEESIFEHLGLQYRPPEERDH